MFKPTLIIFCLLLITGCNSNLQEKIQQQQRLTQQKIQSLQQELDDGQLRNAVILREYGNILKNQYPQQHQLINQLILDASSRGPLFQSLQQRLASAIRSPEQFTSKKEEFNELRLIFIAADPIAFNDALTDPINVLADLSQGALPRIAAENARVSQAANNADNFGIGQQLIGNPAYGQWLTDTNGMSFWQWYGMYALLSNVSDFAFNRHEQRVYYNNWGRARDYSYYHDYGRKLYSSPNQIRNQNAIEAAAKKFATRNGFESAYAKPRKGGRGLSALSKSLPSSGQNTFRVSNSKFNRFAARPNRFFTRKSFGYRRR